MLLDGFQQVAEGNGVLVAGFGFLAFALQGFFHCFHIGQRQFGVDDLDVGQWIDLAGDVDDVAVFKAAHDVGDGVGFADVGEELVAQAFALGSAGNEAGDVDEFDDGRLYALRFDDVDQRLHARVRYLDDADVGLDGTERVVFSGNAGAGDGIEQGGFAHVGQTDDSTLHGCSRFIGWDRLIGPGVQFQHG